MESKPGKDCQNPDAQKFFCVTTGRRPLLCEGLWGFENTSVSDLELLPLLLGGYVKALWVRNDDLWVTVKPS